MVISTDAGEIADVKAKFDLIIDTVLYVHDLNPYLPSLLLNGTLVLVGFLGNLEPTLNTLPLIMRPNLVAGSVLGGIPETQELLDFCSKHGISANIELIKIQDINEAYKRMLKSDVKYRFVIDMASI
jgi:alcohol dehydrogenase (NADP+)